MIASGVFSIFIDYDLSFKFIFQWYVFVDVGFVLSRSSIRFLAGIVRKLDIIHEESQWLDLCLLGSIYSRAFG